MHIHILSSSPSKYESNRKGESTKNRASYNGPVAARSNGTLESKRSTMIRQSASHGNLTDDDFLFNTSDRGQVKRTKSFWKFGKSDTEDIVEGMAMWRHRDLIQPEEEMRLEQELLKESTLKKRKEKSKAKQQQEEEERNKGRGRSVSSNRVKEMQQNIQVPIIDDHAKYQLTKSEIDQRIGKTKERFHQEVDEEELTALERSGKQMVRDSETELGYAEDEEDMTIEENLEVSINKKQQKQQHQQQQNSRMKSYEVNHLSSKNNNKLAHKYYDDMMMMAAAQEMDDERFYDDESMNQEVVVMKTVKRKEILKQYYSSGTSDTERHSSSSDPYDCIVVQDQSLTRNKNNVFNNTSASTTNRKNNKNKEMTTFRSEFSMNKNNNMESDQPPTATILPRTKLVKNTEGKKSGSSGSSPTGGPGDKKKAQNVDPKLNGERKNLPEESKRNSLASAKSYGPWYDLWGANGNNNPHNSTLIAQK